MRRNGLILRNEKATEHLAAARRHALSNRVALGVEYGWSFFSLDPRTVAGNQADGSADVQMIAARLTIKIGRDEPEPLK